MREIEISARNVIAVQGGTRGCRRHVKIVIRVIGVIREIIQSAAFLDSTIAESKAECKG